MQESGEIVNRTDSANGNIYKYFMYRFDRYDTGMSDKLNDYMTRQKENNHLVNNEILTLKERTEEVQFSLSEQNAARKEILGSIKNISSLNQQTVSGAGQMAASSESLAEP